MGTRADVYVGKGKKIEWLGSLGWDAYPDSPGLDQSHPEVMRATDERAFREAVAKMFAGRKDATLPEHGWPWPWEDSRTTDFAYTFDKGKVWLSEFGRRWVSVATYLAWTGEQREAYGETGKEIAFPNMKDRQRVTFGKRSGVTVIQAGPEGVRVLKDDHEIDEHREKGRA